AGRRVEGAGGEGYRAPVAGDGRFRAGPVELGAGGVEADPLVDHRRLADRPEVHVGHLAVVVRGAGALAAGEEVGGVGDEAHPGGGVPRRGVTGDVRVEAAVVAGRLVAAAQQVGPGLGGFEAVPQPPAAARTSRVDGLEPSVRTNTSVFPLVSPATRSVAEDVKAMTVPLSSIDGDRLSPSAWLPSPATLTRVTVLNWRS